MPVSIHDASTWQEFTCKVVNIQSDFWLFLKFLNTITVEIPNVILMSYIVKSYIVQEAKIILIICPVNNFFSTFKIGVNLTLPHMMHCDYVLYFTDLLTITLIFEKMFVTVVSIDRLKMEGNSCHGNIISANWYVNCSSSIEPLESV